MQRLGSVGSMMVSPSEPGETRTEFIKQDVNGLHRGWLVLSAALANNDNITGNTGTPENWPVFPFQDAV